MLSRRDALEELARRKEAARAAEELIRGIRDELFQQQLAVIDDDSRNKATLCTRRAGKTSTWSRYAVIECLRKPRTIVRIWAQARLRAKQLCWEELLDVCRRHRIPVKSHETELSITFENGAKVYLVGADKDKEAQKQRGYKTSLEIVLECQSFGSFLEKLVEEVIEPSLFDLQGTVVLEGTPGPVCAGYWFWVTGDDHDLKRWVSVGRLIQTPGEEAKTLRGANWSCHRWGLLDNPKLPNRATALQDLNALKKRRGWADDNPTWLREYKARWVTDNTALYYRFAHGRNTYALTPETQPWDPPGTPERLRKWSHVLGWDIGFNDSMALVVWAWNNYDETLYEAASWSENGNEGRVNVILKIKEFQQRFNIVRMVADTQGGGKLHVEEIQAREGLVFEPAKKSDKYTHATLMNDDLLTGRIKCIEGSELAQNLASLPKDPDWDPESGKPPGEDPRFPNHVADAGLYSWRWAQAFLAETRPPDAPRPGTPEAAHDEEKRLLEELSNPPPERPFWECDPEAESDDW